MESITPTQLKQVLEKDPQGFSLIDVRETEEHHEFNIGGLLIPLTEISDNQHLIPRDKPVVLYCQIGRAHV